MRPRELARLLARKWRTARANPVALPYIAVMRTQEWFQRREARRLLHPETARALAPLNYYNQIGAILPTNATPLEVLELGCGPGRYVSILAALGHRVTGVDPLAFPFWEEIKRRWPETTLIPDVRAERVPFSDASFDSVVCVGALLYFDDPREALGELRRVLRPGGSFVLSAVNRGGRHQVVGLAARGGPFNVYSLEELTRILADCGLVVDEHFYYGWCPARLRGLWSFLYYTVVPRRLYDRLSAGVPEHARMLIVVRGRAV
jgi:SAM-dependent methyltransferase